LFSHRSEVHVLCIRIGTILFLRGWWIRPMISWRARLYSPVTDNYFDNPFVCSLKHAFCIHAALFAWTLPQTCHILKSENFIGRSEICWRSGFSCFMQVIWKFQRMLVSVNI
jgi:hypothetical protein